MNQALPSRFHAAREAAASLVPEPAVPEPAGWLTEAAPDCSAQLRQQLPPPRSGLQVSVIVPAKDEAEHLPATLAALAVQVTAQGQPLPPDSYEVIVLANNCTDATATLCRQTARRHPLLALHVAELTLPAERAHVGYARRLLMDEACARLERVGARTGLIASTDADTQAAPDWLAATLAEIAAGADAVGGRILTRAGTAGGALRRVQLRDTAYQLLRARLEQLLDPNPADPCPRHHQHFGASLALTARAYRQVGGLPDVRFLEDEALCQALARHDLRLRHSPAVRVFTSDRQQGRVEVGLSWQLREWAALGRQQEPLVESPAQLAARWQLRRQLRAAWQQGPRRTPFGQLWADALAARREADLARVPLSLALAELRTLVAYHERPNVRAAGR